MHCECNASLNLIFDEMLSDEAKPKPWILINEPGGSATDETIKVGMSPEPLKFGETTESRTDRDADLTEALILLQAQEVPVL